MLTRAVASILRLGVLNKAVPSAEGKPNRGAEGGRVWGGGVPLSTGEEVWGGGSVPSPDKFLIF